LAQMSPLALFSSPVTKASAFKSICSPMYSSVNLIPRVAFLQPFTLTFPPYLMGIFPSICNSFQASRIRALEGPFESQSFPRFFLIPLYSRGPVGLLLVFQLSVLGFLPSHFDYLPPSPPDSPPFGLRVFWSPPPLRGAGYPLHDVFRPSSQ